MLLLAHKADGNTMLMKPPHHSIHLHVSAPFCRGLKAFVLSVSKSTNAVLLLYFLSFKASHRHRLSHVSELNHKAKPRVTRATPPI